MAKKKRTKANTSSTEPHIIGWREYVDVPSWGLRGIKAKADTGALTSAIDVANLVEVGYGRVRFDVVLSRNKRHRKVTVETPIARRTRVKSSFGHAHLRYVVEAPIKVGPVIRMTELGLVCRKNMLCRMLLGRTTLRGCFIVDPRRTYVYGRKKKKKTTIKKRKRKVTAS